MFVSPSEVGQNFNLTFFIHMAYIKQSITAVLASIMLAGVTYAEVPWWNPGWTQRQKITIDTSAEGSSLTQPLTEATALVRLYSGNFSFSTAAGDGSDLRFVAADGTVLPHLIESYNNDLYEAFVWVKLPSVPAAGKEEIFVYYGNAEPSATEEKAKVFDVESTLVYHFGALGAAPRDVTGLGHDATAAIVSSEGSLIGNGLRLLGNNPLEIPNAAALEWNAQQTFTLSAWINPGAIVANAVVFSRGMDANAFRIVLDQGVPYVENAGQRSSAGEPLVAGTWAHVALVADGKTLQLYVNGKIYSTLNGVLPISNEPIIVSAATLGLAGEVDQLHLSQVARSADWVKWAFLNQGRSDSSARLISLAEVEGEEAEEPSKVLEHVSLFGDIAKNMMFDGWIAIGVCAIMIVIGWTVAVRKFLYLNSIEKGSKEFLRQWKTLSRRLSSVDYKSEESIRSLGGVLDDAKREDVESSPLYHLYHIGAEEIQHRLETENLPADGLSTRSVQAIRSSLDAGLVHESHRLSNGLVYLTISIAGGPYVGLLGTVVGVMITFAIIAKSGEVNVNSIAPGIASALLATVVGLVVAIPALFIYSYLNARIKNALGLMQLFIDEYVAKLAEFYRPSGKAE